MKTLHILCASVLLLAALPALNSAHAQSKPALVDSANKQLQRGGKPAKAGVTAQSLAPQANGKAKRNVAVPAITQSASMPAVSKSARATAQSDSARVFPPVQRAPIKAKIKPPAR
ncbi:MAG: hypothetical protein ABI120_26310 [Gemmatimonadaceae bacterium]